ncbi:outer membrane lipoprotein-sorting protein [Clostridium tetanomorphum]|uniref:Outer membrane lipoprotein-sorting protein n=1 Tax=Clostridium tetanomorphum TaxID=1553 RepID=A0A923E6D5_CLOTT|nr:outer membrane lipoprotein-sorting protein [Clostridium tetanomorphum]KAJ53701.1 hypothetical protein CTM_00490 [Clostridium tetanomorphum DSM 665]MBC2397213.1 outer membrane lipoprotein-sorting protein [Clostridium tetanomorphum]MBP1862428.1 outer membrane lipoprotein-sorting protein [Clostridium tetanomorphum]NRS85732.1 outer membrane lipoprotein-sorting protein [Clostridium tetanomorphum]NRZ96259.1 outer membrane lipoprotein-sorting protein [Clostridium tetanomorphum]
MIKKRVISIFIGALVGVTALVGCETKTSILPEKIVAHAMEVDNKVKPYYGESRMVIYGEGNKIVEDTILKEWYDTSNNKMRIRIESYDDKNNMLSTCTNDGNNILMYMSKDKKVLTMKSINSMDMPIKSQREQTKQLLEIIKKSHNVTTVGEEKVNGIEAYHIKAVPKEKDSLIGNQDMWIDKNNWFVVKSISLAGNTKIECEYTKLDFSPKIDDSLFTQKIPSDVKVENLENMGPKVKEMSLKDIKGFLGNSFSYFSETSGYKINKISLNQYKSKVADDEIIMDYQKNNKPCFSISLRKGNKANSENGKIPGEKYVTIRGQKGFVINDGICIIGWTEGNVNYSVILQDNSIKYKEFIKTLDKMEVYK